MSHTNAIVPREGPELGLDGDIPKYWLDNDPFKTRFFDAMSLLFPEGEKFFIACVRDYRDQLDLFHPSANAYSSIHYTLMAADDAHIAVGVGLVVWLLWKLRSGLTRYRAVGTLAIAWYWHFVDLATLLVTATLLTARL